MKKTLIAGLAGLSLAFAAIPALADGKKSVDATPIGELAADPAAKAVLDKELPGVTQHPAYDQFKGMTLRQLQPMAGSRGLAGPWGSCCERSISQSRRAAIASGPSPQASSRWRSWASRPPQCTSFSFTPARSSLRRTAIGMQRRSALNSVSNAKQWLGQALRGRVMAELVGGLRGLSPGLWRISGGSAQPLQLA